MRPSLLARRTARAAALAGLCLVASASADEIVGVTADNQLVTFDASAPGTVLSTVAVTGLAAGENLLGLDSRPADGRLYGLGSSSVLYVIDHASGLATQVGTGPFTPSLAGTDFGFDFNPVPDRVRVVGDADQNLRLNPGTGVVAGLDTSLAFDLLDANALANPNVVAVAYDRSVQGATATTLFGIDSGVDALVRIGSVDGTPMSPNGGVLTTIGPLGVDATGLAGLDIAAAPSNTAYAALQSPGAATSNLYTIDRATGVATSVGAIGGGKVIRDIAVAYDRIRVGLLIVKLNFKKEGRDQIQLDAVLSRVGAPVEGRQVTVDVGGAAQTFTIEKNGHARSGDDTLFAKADKKVPGEVRIKMHLKKDDFSDELTGEGMNGAVDANHEARRVLLTILYGGESFLRDVTLDYKAKAGRNGVAKATPGDGG